MEPRYSSERQRPGNGSDCSGDPGGAAGDTRSDRRAPRNVHEVTGKSRVIAVLVTWNRVALLAESLEALRRQTAYLHNIVVVDNASDDGTPDFLQRGLPDVDVVRARRNTGGSGGFALGLDRALRIGCDAVWLLDDDTVPTVTALENLLDSTDAYPGERPVLVASRVVWSDGRDHPMNTPRPKPGARRRERRAAAAVGCVPIRSASFVSILVDAAAVAASGLPLAAYFLWNDDFEFTTRVIRGRRALYCPASVVVHKTATFGSTDADPGKRFYYEVRNKVWLFSRSSGLNPAEKLVYGGATLRRWARTLATSSDRSTVWHALGRGVRDGVRSGPRPTAEVLASAGSPESGGDG